MMNLRRIIPAVGLSLMSFAGTVEAQNSPFICNDSALNALILNAIDPLYSPPVSSQMSTLSSGTDDDVANIRHMTELALSRMDVSEEVTPETTALFGDKVDMNTGAVSFEHVDVALRGNSSLPVEVRRVYRGSKSNRFNSSSFGDWSLEVPSITTSTLAYVDNDLSHTPLCNSGSFDYLDTGYATIERAQYWSGDFLHIPGILNQRILKEKENANAISAFFAENWKVIPLTDRYGFEAISPEGTVYTFDVVRLIPAGQIAVEQELNPPVYEIGIALLPTYTMNIQASRVEDRHGNWVNYNYMNATTLSYNGNPSYLTYSNKLTSITSSDSRTISISYEQGFNTDRVASVGHDGRIWTYSYEEAWDTRLQVKKDVLTNVERPDGRSWKFSMEFDLYGGYQVTGTDLDDCNAPYLLTKTSSMTHPHGAELTLTHRATRFGRSNVPYSPDNFDNFQMNVGRCFTAMAVVEKELNFNNNLLHWDYSYSENPGSTNHSIQSTPAPSPLHSLQNFPLPASYDAMNLRSSSVSNPDGSRTTHVFNREYGALEGKEVFTLYYDTNGSTLLRAIEQSYLLVSNQGSPLFRSYKPPGYPVSCIGEGDCGNSKIFDNPEQHENHIYPAIVKTTDYGSDGVSVFITEYSQYNAYGKPLRIREESIFGERHTRTIYQHNTQQWVLNLPEKTEISEYGSQWTTTAERTYHMGSLLPNQEKRFGQVVISAQDYHGDGSLLRQTYNATNRYIELRDYQFGIPTKIRVPKRYTTSGYEEATQTVNTRGWVTAITDFNGVLTGYAHDDMGRVTLIEPQGIFVPTTITYHDTFANYFVQTISRGSSYSKTTTMDGLLRPVRVEESALAADNRVIEQQFDAYNNPVFVSYPSVSTNESNGMVYEYDGLQRLKAQFSNVNYSGETREYLSGNRVLSTNARNYSTTTTFRALGAPNYEQVAGIEQPEGVTTDITYNLFGNPTQIAQNGYIEVRRYDGQQNLCRIARGDVGDTVYSYNALGEVVWEAKGASGSDSDCNLESVLESEKSYMTYDNVGSLHTITYPDSSGTITHTYDPQGNLLELISGSNEWEYAYNTLGQVESEKLKVDTQEFQFISHYNALGHLSSHVYPSNEVVNYVPNGYGEATQSGVYVDNVMYAPSGQLLNFDYANGLSFSQILDSQLRPELRTVSNAQTLFSHSYQYDDNHNIKIITDGVISENSMNMTYDGLDRLETASGFWGNGSFDYDELGNLEQKQLGNDTLIYNYSNNRLMDVSGALNRSFGYDARGNITNNGTRTFTFNRAGRLASSGSISYQYDGHGRRILKNNGGSKTYSLYSQQGRLISTVHNGTVTDYIYLGSQMVARRSNNQPNNNQPGYTGHLEDDDLQLTYMQQRYYDPVIGRFYSNDPVGFTASKPMMFNRYAYANNNPYKYVDPDGREFRVAQNLRQDYDTARAYLVNRSDVAAAYFQRLEKHEIVIHLEFAPLGETRFVAHSGGGELAPHTIYWNPNEGLLLSSGEGQSPATGLIHEVIHVLDFFRNEDFGEAHVLFREGRINQETGEGSRNSHEDGDITEVSGPTCTPTNSGGETCG